MRINLWKKSRDRFDSRPSNTFEWCQKPICSILIHLKLTTWQKQQVEISAFFWSQRVSNAKTSLRLIRHFNPKILHFESKKNLHFLPPPPVNKWGLSFKLLLGHERGSICCMEILPKKLSESFICRLCLPTDLYLSYCFFWLWVPSLELFARDFRIYPSPGYKSTDKPPVFRVLLVFRDFFQKCSHPRRAEYDFWDFPKFCTIRESPQFNRFPLFWASRNHENFLERPKDQNAVKVISLWYPI